MMERKENIASQKDRLDSLVDEIDTANMINHPLSEIRIRQIFKGDENGDGIKRIFHKKLRKANGLPTSDLLSVVAVMNRILDEENIPEDVANEIVKYQEMVEG